MRVSIGKNQEATATITEIYLMVSSMRFACLLFSPILYYPIVSIYKIRLAVNWLMCSQQRLLIDSWKNVEFTQKNLVLINNYLSDPLASDSTLTLTLTCCCMFL